MAGKHSSNTEPAKTSRTRSRPSFGNAEPLNHEQERIKKWLKQVRFKRVFVGGVDEADMWKKIAELNSLYEAALSAERARYDALLAEYKHLQQRIYYNRLYPYFITSTKAARW